MLEFFTPAKSTNSEWPVLRHRGPAEVASLTDAESPRGRSFCPQIAHTMAWMIVVLPLPFSPVIRVTPGARETLLFL